jgi:hypothetical protein
LTSIYIVAVGLFFVDLKKREWRSLGGGKNVLQGAFQRWIYVLSMLRHGPFSVVAAKCGVGGLHIRVPG